MLRQSLKELCKERDVELPAELGTRRPGHKHTFTLYSDIVLGITPPKHARAFFPFSCLPSSVPSTKPSLHHFAWGK